MAPRPASDIEDLRQQSLSSFDDEFWGAKSRAGQELLIALSITLVAKKWAARATELFKDLGYTAAQRAHLYILARAPKGLTQSELASVLHVSDATLSRRIALSVDEGLVSRQNLIGDGRANLIRLEERGRKALEESDRVARIDRAKLFQDISEAEIATTLKVLKALSDGVARPIKTSLGCRPSRNPTEIE